MNANQSLFICPSRVAPTRTAAARREIGSSPFTLPPPLPEPKPASPSHPPPHTRQIARLLRHNSPRNSFARPRSPRKAHSAAFSHASIAVHILCPSPHRTSGDQAQPQTGVEWPARVSRQLAKPQRLASYSVNLLPRKYFSRFNVSRSHVGRPFLAARRLSSRLLRGTRRQPQPWCLLGKFGRNSGRKFGTGNSGQTSPPYLISR